MASSSEVGSVRGCDPKSERVVSSVCVVISAVDFRVGSIEGSMLAVEESAAMATKAAELGNAVRLAKLKLGVIKSAKLGIAVKLAKLGITPPWSSCCARSVAG